MCKKIFLTAILFLLSFGDLAYANKVKIWRDPSLKISEVNSIIVMPVTAELRAGQQLLPPGHLAKELESWVIKGIKSAAKNKDIFIKTLREVIRDEAILYGTPAKDLNVLLAHIFEMGYDALMTVNIVQDFQDEYIPAQTFNYVTYQTAYFYDRKGWAGSIEIPENRSVTIPEMNLTYLYTLCVPALFLVEDCLYASINNTQTNDYRAIVSYERYKLYRGGPVLKVVENVITASMKSLFTGKK